VPKSKAAVHPVPVHGAQQAEAVTVTTPDAPALHSANPLWLMVAVLGLDNDHCDGSIADGEGGWL
jgi:hypothetical protein